MCMWVWGCCGGIHYLEGTSSIHACWAGTQLCSFFFLTLPPIENLALLDVSVKKNRKEGLCRHCQRKAIFYPLLTEKNTAYLSWCIKRQTAIQFTPRQGVIISYETANIHLRGIKEICQQDARSQFHLAVVLHICANSNRSKLLVCVDNKI